MDGHRYVRVGYDVLVLMEIVISRRGPFEKRWIEGGRFAQASVPEERNY